MIQIRSVSYSYPPTRPTEEPVIVLKDVSFDVAQGSCLAVTGPNGCGKTTLCLAIAGLAPRLTSGHLTGHITVGGRDVQAEPPGALADLIGVVFQDPTGQLFNPTVEEEIAWGLENLGLPRAEMQRRIERALDMVGLANLPRDQAPETLSGGQQRRLALAAALAMQPAVLILDDPSGGLAPAARAEMIAVLRDLRRSSALTILLASGDSGLIAELANEMIVLEDGRVIERGDPHIVYPRLSHPAIIIPPASRFAALVNQQRGLGLSCLTPEEAIEQTKRYPLNGVKPPRPEPTYPTTQPAAEAAIQIEGLSFAYRPDQPVLRDLNLSIPRGQFVVLTGDNGAGKTTLARHLIGLLRPTAGHVRVLGADIAGQPVGRLARQVGFVFQNPELHIFNPTARQEVAFGPRNLGLPPAVVEGALRHFDLLEIAEQPPAVLSFSARRMVALAAVAAMNTPILVLDEPTVGLDAAGTRRVMDWLAERHRAGATILLITHDMELAATHAERVLIMQAGRIIADGSPRAIFAQAEVLAEAGLEAPFAVRLADSLHRPALCADLTPQGAALAWLEHLR